MWSVIAIGLFNSIMFPTIFTARDRAPRSADQQGVEPAGDGDRRRRDRAVAAGRARRPHRHPARVRAAAAVLRLHRLVRLPRVAARRRRADGAGGRARKSRRGADDADGGALRDRLLRRGVDRFPGAAAGDARRSRGSSSSTPAARRPTSPSQWRGWAAMRASSACSARTCSASSCCRSCARMASIALQVHAHGRCAHRAGVRVAGCAMASAASASTGRRRRTCCSATSISIAACFADAPPCSTCAPTA